MIKRGLDFGGAIILLVLCSPIFLVLYLLVRLKLGCPVFFSQKRPGLNGNIFTMYKFRTMTDAKDTNGALLPDEKRMTKLGRFLRSSSLDELPELFNILKGEMSFVGPRPQLVRDMVFFTEEQMRRQSVMPGLTGWAQVNGRNSISWENKFKYDLEYIERQSILFDMKILFMTAIKVIKREGIQATGMETAEDLGDYLLRVESITETEYDQKQAVAACLLVEERE